MYKTLTTLLVFLSFPILAQDFDNYQLLRNQGPIPASFTTPSSKKYEAEILNMDKELRAREQKDQKQFYLETNFVIDDLLKSGKVLFGTEVNTYVNKVGNKVLEAVPELKDKVEFYVLRSSAVNAFATNQGIVFINMGLLAQLENEAQLAFIIAHELTHVQKQHSLNKFLNKKDINRNMSRKRLLQSSDFDEALVATNSYSKELEFEADKGGLDIYLKTDYSLEEIKGVFDVLRYAHFIFDQTVFDKEVLNKKYLQIPPHLFYVKGKYAQLYDDQDSTKTNMPNTIRAIDLNETLSSSDNTTLTINKETKEVQNKKEVEHWELEKHNTHPSPKERAKIMLETAKNTSNEGKKAFLVSNQKFNIIRTIARFELVYYYMHYFRFEDAMYTAYLLKKEYPESKYLDEAIVKSWYYIAKFKKGYEENPNYAKSDSIDIWEKFDGYQKPLYWLTERISAKAATVIALRNAWDYSITHPNNNEVNNLVKDLFKNCSSYYPEFTSFKSMSSDSLKKMVEGINKEDTTFNFEDYVFTDLIEISEFKNLYQEGLKAQEKEDNRIEYYLSEEGKLAWAEELNLRNKKGAALNIDSILIINPYYIELDGRKDNAYRYLRTEKGQQKFLKMLTRCADKADMHYLILDVNKLDSQDVEIFNEIQLLNLWFSQQSRFGDWNAIGLSQDQIDKIAQKYGTNYILKTGLVLIRSGKHKTMMAFSAITLNLLFTLPVAILSGPTLATAAVLGGAAAISLKAIFSPKYETLYYSVIFDVENQRFQVLDYKVIGRRPGKNLLKSHIYNSLHQIKSSRKNK